MYSTKTTKIVSRKQRTGLLATTALALALFAAAAQPAASATKAGSPTWTPKSSERLVKLPSTILKKSIDQDFIESTLGKALQTTNEEIGLKAQTLADLQKAIEQAEGEVKTELRHQFLAEKRAFIDMMTAKNDIRRKQLRTQKRLFEKMLKKFNQEESAMSPARERLIASQDAARKRFQTSLDGVDMEFFETSSATQSKYAVKSADLRAAREKLVARVKYHKMNTSIQVDGQPLTKKEYIRQMLVETQGEISILDQEESVLGFMAKLIALDALALAEQTLDAELADSDIPVDPSPANAVEFFMSN